MFEKIKDWFGFVYGQVKVIRLFLKADHYMVTDQGDGAIRIYFVVGGGSNVPK